MTLSNPLPKPPYLTAQSKVEQSCLCPNAQCGTLNARQYEQCRNCGCALQIQGRYRIVREVGHGQFAKTFVAIDQQSGDQRCIIKQFVPKLKGIDFQQLHLARNLFQQEALILQRLGEHPQIPTLIGYGEDNTTQFLIQEYIPGRSLYHQVQQSPQPFKIDIKALLLELLPVLEFVHSHGIIHRDIKLGNIIQSTSGQLWLIDFGSAFHQNFGRFGISGTPGYAAPEQLQGQASPASDLYSLAVTCVSLLSGHILETNQQQAESPDDFLTDLETHAAKISPQLAHTLERMLQPKAENRYQSAQDILDELTAVQSLQPTQNVVDYTRLKHLLAQEHYQEADQETWQLLLALSHSEIKLTIDAIDRLPLQDLHRIDQLWSVASHKRFGFSAQFKLYQSLGADFQHFNYQQWQAFAEQVGWCDRGRWLRYRDLSFSAQGPTGQLPAIFTSSENRQGYSAGPLDWWRLGFISFMERLFLS